MIEKTWIIVNLDWIVFPLILILLVICLLFQLRKLKKLTTQGKSSIIKDYGKNIIIGIVASIVVIVLDRGTTLVFKNHPTVDYTSLITIIETGLSGFIILAIDVTLILLLIVWIINKGLFGLIKEKK